ncbi:MAG: transglycosylase domain-containing protein [Sulfurovum sp.]|nr:transglycosylase domain-containing protein [Sulfurovum sp.]
MLSMTIVFFVFMFLLLDRLYPLDTKMLDDTSRVIHFENKTWAYVTTNKEDKWRFPVKISAIDPQFIRLLLFHEDQRFYSHYGIDPLAMLRAVGQLISQGRVISGVLLSPCNWQNFCTQDHAR